MKRRPPPNPDLCPSTGDIPTGEVKAPMRPIPRCDPPDIPPAPDYQLPDPVDLLVPPNKRLPDPHFLLSPEAIADCSQWPAYTGGEIPVGSVVTVEAGAYTELFYLQSLPLPVADLYFAAEKQAQDPAGFGQIIEEQDIQNTASFFQISIANATLIVGAVTAAYARLYAQANSTALFTLDCSWCNSTVTLYCEGAGAEVSAGSNPIIIEECSFTSPNSKAEADAFAEEAALSLLNCVFCNDPVTVVCSDLDVALAGLDPGNTSQANGDFPELYPEIIFKNSVFVDGCTIQSSISKADANAQALSLGVANLSCFYIQEDEEEVACPDFPAPIDNPIIYDGVSTGSPVTIPAGYAYSTVSMAEAQAAAIELATDSLFCDAAGPGSLLICCPTPGSSGSGGGGGDCNESWPELEVGVNPTPPLSEEEFEAERCLQLSGTDLNGLVGLSSVEQDGQIDLMIEAYLVCDFFNDELEVCCPGEDAGSGGVMPGLEQCIKICAATYSSPISQEEANHLAEEAAKSLLVCLYCNEAIPSTVCERAIEACIIVSAISVEDANAKAEALDASIPCPGSSSESESSSGGGGGGGGSSSSGSESNGGGSDKSTAIVPLPGSKYGYTALLTMEAPEVLFEDVLHVPIRDQLTRYPIDPRFIAVCEPKSVNAISVTTDRPALVGARVIGRAVVLEINPMGGKLPSMAHVKLCGTRRGFAGMRFPHRDEEQFLANEKTLNSAYPAKDL